MYLPPVTDNVYNKSLPGFAGQLGDGGNAVVRYLQTGISSADLDSLTLIENIPGSEKWEVRDLFQRDVDDERVSSDLLPYLEDPQRIKYFNPLTLVLLPLAHKDNNINKEIPYIEPYDRDIEGHIYQTYEVEKLYRFNVHKQAPCYSTVEWNDRQVKIVAIDGQHRLSALKRLKNRTGGPAVIDEWTIPVIVLGILRTNPDQESDNLLDIVRKMFVYINSKAERVNAAREILLNDESVNCICTQSLLQVAHENDCRPIDNREKDRVPLIFYDWRGSVRKGVRIPGPAAVKSTEEIHQWFEVLLFGEDGGQEQKSGLAIGDMIPPISNFGPEKILSSQDAERLRIQIRETILPGLSYLLENFEPYKRYIGECYNIEQRSLNDSDYSEHAFIKLRFGTHRAGEEINEQVKDKYDELLAEFEALKNRSFDELLRRDIGMRAIVAAFSATREYWAKHHSATPNWIDHAKWFVPLVNKVYNDGWFRAYERLTKNHRQLLTHVCYDPAGGIVNYKFKDVQASLGVLVMLVVCSKQADREFFDYVFSERRDDFRTKLLAGYRKQHRSDLSTTYKGTAKQFRDEIKKLADISTNQRLDLIEKQLRP